MINELIDEVSIDISDVETFAVAVGPGSFTGLRIGIGASLGLGDCFGAVVAGIGTLDAMARVSDDTEAAYLCPIIEARRGKVYAALYSRVGGKIEKLTDDMETTAESLAEMIDGDVLFTGDGYRAHATFLQDKIRHRVEAVEAPARSCAEGVALIAYEMAEKGDLSEAPVVPRYVSRPQAELNLMKLQTSTFN
jgi:tRNA threonylcarbamoyladenosine biosynthesis protein TsaB